MIRQALVAPLLLAFLIPALSLAQSPLEDAGCTKAGNAYSCPQASVATGIEATYLDDVECYSLGNATCTTDCAGLVDVGCFAFIKVGNDVSYTACDTTLNATDVSYNRNCRTEVLRAGNLTAVMNPEIIDYSACSKAFEEGIYVIHCPYMGRLQLLNASVAPEGLFVIEAADKLGFAITLEVLVILILVAAIALVALWILRPPKAGRTAGERRLRRRERRQ